MGGSFFWEDLLGPSNHPSIIVGSLKVHVVWDLPNNFVGPPAGLRRLTTVPKVFHCPKISQNRRFGQNSAGRAGDSFLHIVSALKCSTMMFCNPKKFYVMFRRPPATYGRLKNGTFFQKWQKMTKNSLFWRNFVNVCRF